MLARWKTVALRQRKRRTPSQAEADAAACTPLAASTHGVPQRKSRFSSRSASDQDEDDDAESISSVLSDDSSNHVRSSPGTDWRHQTLLQRVVAEKNRFVQRTLVTFKFADASKDMYFTKKQREYDQAIQLLVDTREIVELYAQSLLDVSAAVRGFAGNASDVRIHERGERSTTTFLIAAETIEEQGYNYMDEVRENVLRSIDDRVEDLTHISGLLRERGNLQVDVDYAKRTLVVAQKRGDVNIIADKKKALQVAQLRRREATRQIAQLLRHYDNKQEAEFDSILTEFASITKKFFQGSAALLRAVELPQRRGYRSSATFLSTRRLTPPVSDRDPIVV